MIDSQKRLIFRLGFIVLIAMAVYGTTLKNGFVWDDTFIIVNNPLIEKIGNIPRFFLSEDTIEETTGYYRPVTYISFALDRSVWGVNPAGFHLTNLILHIMAVLLFYRVVAALFNKERLAFTAAVVFALHPLTGETVNFLSGGRNTLLSACFGLLSLLCYIKKKHVPAVAGFTFAIFSKEFALLLPVMFLLYDCRIRREKIRFGSYIPYLISVAIYLVLRSIAVQKANFLAEISLDDALKAPYLVVRYALNMIAPLQLKVLYSVQSGMVSTVLCSVVAVVTLGIVGIFRKRDELLFSVGWFLLFLLPVINIIPLHTTTVMADRYAYFSLMGFALCLASIVDRLNGRSMIAGVVAIGVLYSAIDFSRNSIWKDDIAFFTRMTKDSPGSFVGFKNLGLSYYKTGNIPLALEILEAADSKPDIPVKYLIADASLFWKENRLEQAEKTLLRVRDENPLNPEPYLLLLMICEQKGNTEQAEAYREKIIKMGLDIEQIVRDRTFALCRAGETLMSQRQFVIAEIYLWQALRINPAFIPALVDMGSIRAGQGNSAEAIRYLSKALVLDPLNASAHYNLSELYKMRGQLAESEVEMARFRDAESGAKKKGHVTSPRQTGGGDL